MNPQKFKVLLGHLKGNLKPSQQRIDTLTSKLNQTMAQYTKAVSIYKFKVYLQHNLLAD